MEGEEMHGHLVNRKKVLVPLGVASLLFCLGYLLRFYAETNETMTLHMPPFLEVHRFTALGSLVTGLGVFCWFAALVLVLACFTRKLWANKLLVDW
jgi:hypothetical protein